MSSLVFFFFAHITHGLFQGSFITKPFMHFQKFLERAKLHEQNDWHIESFIRSKDFIDNKKKEL